MEQKTKKEKFYLISYEELEKIFIKCENNLHLNKEYIINKNIQKSKYEIKLPIISFQKTRNETKKILKQKMKLVPY